MHMSNYVGAYLNLLVCIFSQVFECVLYEKAAHEEPYTCMPGKYVSLLACTFSRLLSQALKQQANVQKNLLN